jgi:hypothetical protein
MEPNQYNPITATNDVPMIFMPNIQDLMNQNNHLQSCLQHVNADLFRVSDEYRKEKEAHRLLQIVLQKYQQNDAKLQHQLKRLTDTYKDDILRKDRLIHEQVEKIAALQKRLSASVQENIKDRILFESAIEAHATSMHYATQKTNQSQK